jgi:predicted PhzF superfamily epimerase YddE/YHI9
MTRPKTVPLFLVDAFAIPGRPFSGNPAAVCLLESWPLDAWLAGVDCIASAPTDVLW